MRESRAPQRTTDGVQCGLCSPVHQALRGSGGSAVRGRQAQKWAGLDIAGAPGETEKAVDQNRPSPHQPRPKAPAREVREKGPEREVLS